VKNTKSYRYAEIRHKTVTFKSEDNSNEIIRQKQTIRSQI